MDEDGLHVLSSYVKDEGHVPVKITGCDVMRYCLDDAVAELEGGLHKVLAVAGGAASRYAQHSPTLLAFLFQRLKPGLHCLDGISTVVAVP